LAGHHKERRRSERFQIDNFIGIYKSGTGDMLGCLADISKHGMRMVCFEKPASDEPMQLTIEFPKSICDIGNVNVEVSIIWCKQDDEHYAAGFEYCNMKQESLNALENFIDNIKDKNKVRQLLKDTQDQYLTTVNFPEE
jgi:hypothetical protein